jgi:hypothetical protein
MEEAVAGTSTVTPLPGIESVINIDNIDIDVDNLVDDVDHIGAPFDPSTPIQKYPLLLLVIQIEVPGIRA